MKIQWAPQATLIKWGLSALAAVLILVAVNNYWHQLTDWVPWSTASQLEASQRTAAEAAAEATTSRNQLGEQGAIYDRESHTLKVAPRIIRETEAAAAAAEAATTARAASDAFFDGVCERLQYPNSEPECVSEDNPTDR